MDKKIFLSKINYEDKRILSSIYDKIILAQKIGNPVFTNEFFAPNVWRSLINIENELPTKVHTSGIFNEAERRMVAFYNGDEINFPINLIKVNNKSKFIELSHRDYLGALMAIGLKREKFGDLVVNEESCYFSICEDVCDYVTYGLESVGKCPCEVIVLKEGEYNLNLFSFKYEKLVINVTSNRLDAVISSICNLSRTKAEDIIRQGKVMIDYSVVTEKDRSLGSGAIITVRGYGKFKFEEEIGWTSKGKIKMEVKKFK